VDSLVRGHRWKSVFDFFTQPIIVCSERLICISTLKCRKTIPSKHAVRAQVVSARHSIIVAAFLFLFSMLSPQTVLAQIDERIGEPAPPTPRQTKPTVRPAVAANPDQVSAPPSDSFGLEKVLAPGGFESTLKTVLLFTVLSLVPSILLMTTCFVRFAIVLGLLRQALGVQQVLSNQIVMALSLFLTLTVMTPIWRQSYEEGIRPYTNPEPGVASPDLTTSFENSVRPLRRFMSEQIRMAGNDDGVFLILEFQQSTQNSQPTLEPETFDEVPLNVLLTAFMLSELKLAFIIGFKLYLPFVVIDLVVSALLVSMSMVMMPPAVVSLPFKLLLFVLIDGWFLTVGMLLGSV